MSTPLDFAKALLGLEEKKDKTKLMELFKKYSKNNDIAADPSQEPWCSDFVNLCIRQAGGEGTGKRNARSWLTYGEEVYDKKRGTGNIKNARQGDIVIFERLNNGWSGHVTFIDSVKLGGFVCVGGNQSDKVCAQFYPLSRLLGIRRP